MKRILYFVFAFITYNLGFGQTNPVQNIEWIHWYDFPNNFYGLSWEEPESPHNELIGYNIYRENELYRFQTETSLGCNPVWGYNDCDFIFYIDGSPFTGYVAAVYEGNIESEYISFEVEGPALNISEPSSKSLKIFPNPIKDILYFSEEVTNIKITDISGKTVKVISNKVKSINIANLTKGTYIITAVMNSGEIINRKLVKK